MLGSRQWSTQTLRYPIGDSQRVGNDSQRRIDRLDRGKETRVGNVEVVELVRLAVEIEHRARRIGASMSVSRIRVFAR